MASSTFPQLHEQRKIEKLMLRLATIKPWPTKLQPQQQNPISVRITKRSDN